LARGPANRRCTALRSRQSSQTRRRPAMHYTSPARITGLPRGSFLLGLGGIWDFGSTGGKLGGPRMGRNRKFG
jgi:hypothetical protein